VTNKLLASATRGRKCRPSPLTESARTKTGSTLRSVRVSCPAGSPGISVSTSCEETRSTRSWLRPEWGRWAPVDHAGWPRSRTPQDVRRRLPLTSGRPRSLWRRSAVRRRRPRRRLRPAAGRWSPPRTRSDPGLRRWRSGTTRTTAKRRSELATSAARAEPVGAHAAFTTGTDQRSPLFERSGAQLS